MLLVIHNEEQYIERCVKSFADIADEILVVHDGPCSDRSLELCGKYTDKIFVKEHVGIAEPHIAWLCSFAKNDWLLEMCPDEFLSDALRTHLPELITGDSPYQGYDLLFPILYKSKEYRAYHKLALVNKKFFYFVGCPSEYFQPLNPSVQTKMLDYGLEHRPTYNNFTLAMFRKKWIPWAKLTARYYAKPFSDLITFNCSRKDWYPRLQIRIEHPLVLGVFGSAVYHIGSGFRYYIIKRNFIFFKAGALMALYHIFTFFYLWRLQKKGMR